jgi:hypothetical protein
MGGSRKHNDDEVPRPDTIDLLGAAAITTIRLGEEVPRIALWWRFRGRVDG